ncbi:hypothetical protein ACFT8P_26195 [Streptomyces sp. NPDC057101]|uniref:hypothetical protein n=1 Tax=Streptomyces sp. NPDC057101 TaxID=3346020 RepID=UPI00363AFF5A
MSLPSRPHPKGSPIQRRRDARGRAAGADARALAPEAEAGIARVEGYLLAHQARTEADEAGAAFACRFTWMGPQEKSDVAREFAREHLAMRRAMFRACVARAEGLSAQYGDRYARLRRRLVATVISLAAGMTAVLAVALRVAG